MLIDTHAHLWFPDYESDLEEVLTRAKSVGVEKVIVPGTDLESSRQAVALAKKYPGFIYAAVGVHPEETTSLNFQFTIVNLQTLIAENRENVVAIGEIGMDMSSEELRGKAKEQGELFRAQCELAVEHELPVIIHTRESLAETLEVLDSLPSMPRGQFHCFSHNEVGVKQVLARGFHISFCGNITWSKRVAKLVALVPEDRLLLETDSPFMKPRDKKGNPVQWSKSSDHSPIIAQGSELREPWDKRNEPANVTILAEKIGELRGQSLQDVSKITTANAKTLFNL